MASWASEPRQDRSTSLEAEVGGLDRADAPPAVPAAGAESRRKPRRRRGFLARVAAIGFWAPGISLLVGACASAGFLALTFIPLIGFGYVVFCLVAITGDRSVE